MAVITTRDGTKLHYKDWGTGRPVILIHGWPLSADSWDDLAFALVNAGYHTIAYDRRGFGRSEQPWKGYDYDTLTDDLADVIEATGATDAALVGFSMGGGEVARYFSRYGGKNVSQAALISSVVPYMLQTPDNPNGVPAAMFQQMTDGMMQDRAHFMAGFFKDFYGVGLIKHPVSDEVWRTPAPLPCRPASRRRWPVPSRLARRTSAPTCPRSLSPPWSFMVLPTRPSRLTPQAGRRQRASHRRR